MIYKTYVNASPSVYSYSVKNHMKETTVLKQPCVPADIILAQENAIFNRNDSCVTAVILYPTNDEPVSMVA